MSESQDDGFLGRWSRRKQAVRSGQELVEPQIAQQTISEPQKAVFLEPYTAKTDAEHAQTATEKIAIKNEKKHEKLSPAPSLEDTKMLTPQSDFKPFMRSDVQPEVKNAALKQLFKDPHFNTMDMMDVYVDDYSKPDPLPPEMLRKMAVTKFLGFWKEEEKESEKESEQELAQESVGTEQGAENKVLVTNEASDHSEEIQISTDSVLPQKNESIAQE